MNIDASGITIETLQDILQKIEENLKSTYGADFYIKPEGVIDNIFSSAAFLETDMQEQLAFLAKQFDPESAEGVWQDALYERIGVTRIAAQSTTFTKKILGTAGFSGTAGDITIRSNLTQEEFTNKSDYTLDNNGETVVTFECVVAGATNVIANETFTIVEAPQQITDLATSANGDIDLGRARETDGEFRVRFRNAKGIDAKGTRKANIANLLQYVDNANYLDILDKKNDATFAAGTMEIIAKHNTTDEIFANAIFNTVADGIDLLGNTIVNVTDESNQTVPITFYKADEPEILIALTIKLKTGFYAAAVNPNVITAIMNYINTRGFGLGSVIFATEFVVPVLAVDGVDAVTSVQVKKSTDADYSDSITLTRFEIPSFSQDDITVTES